MDQNNVQQDALKQVAQLRAEVEEVRARLTTDVTELKGRISLDPHVILEKSVQTMAGQAGTLVGTSLSMARKFFSKKSA